MRGTQANATRWPQMKIVSTYSPAAEIESFARWFHEDFGLVFADADEGAREYFEMLSTNRRRVLRNELKAL
jgi:hypothetical protein